jgi:hypothetical protein
LVGSHGLPLGARWPLSRAGPGVGMHQKLLLQVALLAFEVRNLGVVGMAGGQRR